jgi:hypothetical protein
MAVACSGKPVVKTQGADLDTWFKHIQQLHTRCKHAYTQASTSKGIRKAGGLQADNARTLTGVLHGLRTSNHVGRCRVGGICNWGLTIVRKEFHCASACPNFLHCVACLRAASALTPAAAGLVLLESAMWSEDTGRGNAM